jgi:glycosyltransferase involved in cell wall biosynthesis
MTARVVICRSNPIDPDPRVEKTAHTLSDAGYLVSILGWDRTGELPVRKPLDRSDNSIQVYRLPIKAEFGHGIANLPNLLRWQWGLMKWLSQNRAGYDLIHACDFDTILPALICRLLWGKPVIYDIFDFYADHLRATPVIIKRLIRWLDLRAIGWADALILADDSRYTQIEGSKPKRSVVIYNSPRRLSVPPIPERSPHPNTSLNIAYIGLLQVERGLIEMLQVMKCHPDWSLDLAGFGGDEAAIVPAAERMPNVTWHGRISYDRAMDISQAADILFATYDPLIPNHRYSSPNKVFEAMMLGKPIIVARNTNMDRIVEQAECGTVVPYGDVSVLDDALESLQTDPELRRKLGKNGQRAYESTYGWDRMHDRLLTLYSEVITNPVST